MAQHNQLGVEGEQKAVDYLKKNGFEILNRNFRWKHLEIDIIAKKADFTVFVEVKTRSNDQLVELSQMISKKKQSDLIKAANHFIEVNEIDTESRFDVIIIIRDKIDHIQDAFYPGV